MPNYVRNILKMDGIADLPLFTEVGGAKELDFNLLISMPAELMMEEGSNTERCVMFYLTERCSIQLQELDEKKLRVVSALVGNQFSSKWPEEVFRRVSEWMNDASEPEKDKAYADGRQYVSNYEKYGAATWYGWSIRNWGTKWNAGKTVILDRDTIQFDTAWSNPAPIVQKLGELYPALRIEHWWADEDVGSNTGHRILFDGGERVECFERDKDALAIFTKCWGESNFAYIDENGEMQYRDGDEQESEEI